MMAYSISQIRRTLELAAAAAIITALGQSALGSQWPASSFARPHPAVVRVISPERDGTSFGSGALVETNEVFGLVLTNWHVVRDAAGVIGVFFPDGFCSAATVVRTDRDWDLAALLIWRPKAQPIALAAEPPRPGELLTIAGYGSGAYRASAGRCTQYASPGGNQPFELVELDTPARDGDSGGPILNQRGELAGVLFGSAFGRTTGSHSGRVGWFLGTVAGDFRRVTDETLLARRQQARVQAPTASIVAPPAEARSANAPAAELPRNETESIAQAEPYSPAATLPGPAQPKPNPKPKPKSPSLPPEIAPPAALPTGGGIALSEQVKTALAIIGAIAVGYQALRFLGWMVG
jgi:hypothetical protein